MLYVGKVSNLKYFDEIPEATGWRYSALRADVLPQLKCTPARYFSALLFPKHFLKKNPA